MAESWADLAAPTQPTSGESWADLSTAPPKATVKPGTPVLTNRSAPSLFRNPGAALANAWDRMKESASTTARDWTLSGVASRALGDALGGQPEIPKDKRPAADPARSGLELTADLLGGFGGSLGTPESLVSLPARALGAVSRPIAQALAKTGLSQGAQKVATAGVVRAAEGAAVNTASDPLIQGANIAMGDQEKYDLGATGMNALFGAALGGGVGAAGKAVEVGGQKKAAQAATEAQRVDDYIVTRAQQTDPATDWSDLSTTQTKKTAATPATPGDWSDLAAEAEAPDIAAMRAYHGSKVADLGELKVSDRGALGPGVYLTPDDRIAKRYGENVYEVEVPEGVFNGMGSRDSSVNPYEVWREQMDRLIAAAPDELKPQIAEFKTKLQPQDGYPLFKRVAQLYGDEMAAQGLFRDAGFRGVSGWADGPEIVLFDNVGLRAAGELPDILNSPTGVVLPGAPTPSTVGAIDPASIPVIERNLKNMAADLRDALGVTHRQGRVGARGAAGTYNRKSGIVRTLAMHEMDVLSHETAHHLEFTKPQKTLLAAMKKHEAELLPLDYDKKLQRRHEGFAEWFRVYMTDPALAAQQAPNFTPAFEAAMQADLPKPFAKIKELQAEHGRWIAATPASRMAARIEYQGPKGVIEKAKARLDEGGAEGMAASAYTQMVDRLHPIARAVDELIARIEAHTGQKVNLKAAYDPYKMARMMPTAYSTGHMNIMNGVDVNGDFTPVGPSLAEAMSLAMDPRAGKLGKWDEQAHREFDAYLISRRMIGEYQRYAQGKLDQAPDAESLAAHEQAVRDFETANPTWADAAAKVYEWQNNMWLLKRNKGLISEQTYQAGLEHKDYVPALRDREDVPGLQRGNERSGDGEGAGKVQRFRGSTRNPISPTQSMMKDAYRTAAIVARNDVYGMLYDLADKAGPFGGPIVEKLPIPTEVTNIEKLLAEFAKTQGLNPRDVATMIDDVKAAMNMKPSEGIQTYKAGEFNAKQEPIVYFWKDGQVVPLRLPDGVFGKELFDALTNLTPAQKTLASELLTIPSRVQRVGIVTHPTFMIANAMRDAITTFITTDVGYIPFYDTFRGIGMDLSMGRRAEQYNRAGGTIGGVHSSTERDGRISQSFEALNKKGIRFRRFSGWDGVAHIAEITETGTRMGVFDRAVKDLLAKGYSEREAILEAAFIARDYMDFDKRGASDTVTSVQSLDTFLRAWTISMDKFVEVTKGLGNLKKVLAPLAGGPPATAAEKRAFNMAMKAYTTMIGLGAMSAGLTAYNLEHHPEYQEINDDLRATHWIFKTPDWVPRYGGEWAFIPKPFEWGAIPDFAERLVEAQDDPTIMKRMANDMRHIFAPPFNVPVITLPWQLGTNKTSMGQPIVPDYLMNAEPDLQVTAATSQLGRDLGDAFDLSPARVDHVIKSLGTSWARTVLDFYDRVRGGQAPREGAVEDDFIMSRFVKNPARGNRSSEKFWDLVSTRNGKFAKNLDSYRAYLDDPDPDMAVSYLRELEPDARAYVAMAALPNLSGEERRIHPMIMAQTLIGEMGSLRNALREGDVRAAGLQYSDLTPAERTAADQALQQRIMATAGNALAASGVEGWMHRSPTDLAPLPEAVQAALTNRLATSLLPSDVRVAALANPAVGSALVTAKIAEADTAWAQIKPALDALDAQVLGDLASDARMEGMRGVSRVVDQVQPAR